MDPKYLSEVTLRISEEPDGRFKGHIIAPGSERMVTVPNKDRDRAVANLMSEARNILKGDNYATPRISHVGTTGGSRKAGSGD